jgi:hypothetical protein
MTRSRSERERELPTSISDVRSALLRDDVAPATLEVQTVVATTRYPGLIDVRRMRRAYAREMVDGRSYGGYFGGYSWRFTMVLGGRRLVFFGVAMPHSNSTCIVCAGASALDVARDAYRWFRSALLDHYVLPSSIARAAHGAAVSANVIPPTA